MKAPKYFLVFTLLLLIASCSHSPSTPTMDRETYSPTRQASTPTLITLTPSVTPIPILPTDGPTATFFAIETNTPTAVPALPTWTPLPTLLSQDALDKIRDLLTNNAGCELSCWWGIVPGETTGQYARQFLSQFAGNIIQGDARFSVYNKLEEYPDEVISTYFINDGVVELIKVEPTGTERRYQVNQLLEIYGKPEEVVLDAEPVTPDGMPYFFLVLFYPAKGIVAIYDGPAKLNSENEIEICPQNLGPELILVKPQSRSLNEMKKLAYDAHIVIPSLNSIPGTSIAIFYEQMKEPAACFVVGSR